MTHDTVEKTGPANRRASRDSTFEIAFGQRIRAARVAAKMTQTALGKAAGVSFQQIQKYEQGRDRISVGALQAIADALGIAPGSFFGDQASVQSSTLSEMRAAQRVGARILAIKDQTLVQKLMTLVDLLANSEGQDIAPNGRLPAGADPEMAD